MLLPIAKAPQPDAKRFGELVHLIDQPHPDELQLKRCEYGIERCIQGVQPPADLARCFTARAMVRLIRRDAPGALAAAHNAALLRPTRPEVIARLLMLLRSVGAYAAAGELADRLTTSATSTTSTTSTTSAVASVSCAREIVLTCLAQFRDGDALHVLRALGRRGRLLVDRDIDAIAIARRMALRQEAGYTPDDLARLLRGALDVIRNEAGLWPLRCHQQALDDGSCLHWLYLDASVERCAHIDTLILERLIAQFPRVGAEVMSICCLPLEAYFAPPCE